MNSTRAISLVVIGSLAVAGALASGCSGQPDDLEDPEVPPVSQAIYVNPSVVITQIYGGGGLVGAPFNADYIVINNWSDHTVSLEGWSIQYASARGTGLFGSSSSMIAPISGWLYPGQFLLIRGASGGTNGAPVPMADIDMEDSTPINLSSTQGKVALVDTTTPLGCNGGTTPCSDAQSAHIVDLVGYGGADYYAGTGPAATLSSTTAGYRPGCLFANESNDSWRALSPNPQNGDSPFRGCNIPDTTP